MIVKKAYKFRLYPNKEQVTLLQQTFGCCRKVYNLNLEAFINKEKPQTEAELKITHPFLRDVDSIALQQSRLNFISAKKNFYGKRAKYPKFKNKISRQSYRTVSTSNNIKIDFSTHYITLPKVGTVKYRDLREFSSTIRNVTVTRTQAGNYYAAILVNEDIPDPKPLQLPLQDTQIIGLDMSLGQFYTNNKGTNPVEFHRHYRETESKLKRVQRKLSRKIKGSKNRNKQRIKVAKLLEKVTHKRKDFLHKTSTLITKGYRGICVETLDLSAMKQSPYHLAKSIGDVAWGGFTRMLEYKSSWKGNLFLKADRFFPSSKNCSTQGCNYKNKDLKLGEKSWTCPKCGVGHDRDHNAGCNLVNYFKNTVGITGMFSPWAEDACGDKTTTRSHSYESSLDFVQVLSGKQEAHGFIRG